jgi:hypothetical protein
MGGGALPLCDDDLRCSLSFSFCDRVDEYYQSMPLPVPMTPIPYVLPYRGIRDDRQKSNGDTFICGE